MFTKKKLMCNALYIESNGILEYNRIPNHFIKVKF